MSSVPRVLYGPDHRGRILGGRYLLHDFLGGGGTANVYEGHDYRLARTVAVKVIHPEHVRDFEDRLRVKQEAALTAAIDHPHVMPIYDFGEEEVRDDDPVIYMVMPRAPSMTLRDLIRRLRRALQIRPFVTPQDAPSQRSDRTRPRLSLPGPLGPVRTRSTLSTAAF